MNKIEQSLTKLFEKHRLIFWYDDGGAMKDEFEEVALLGVEKLEIANNEFGIKVKILDGNKEAKYLIYSSSKRPSDRDNWLLDLNLAGYLYSADKIAMWIEELGIDRGLRSVVERHEKFFGSSQRLNALASIVDKSTDERGLCLAMCAVVCGCEPRLESITLKLLEWQSVENQKISELQKYGLDGFLFGEYKRVFGYESKEPSFKELAYALILSHFYSPFAPQKRALNSEAVMFVRHQWMDSVRHKSSFETLSRAVEESMNMADTIAGMSLDEACSVDSFVRIEHRILSLLMEGVSARTLDAQKVELVCKERQKSFWYDGFLKHYSFVLYASKLLDRVDRGGFEMKDAKDGFERYSNEWYKVDTLYRKAVLHGSKLLSSQTAQKLLEMVENAYFGGFLLPLNDRWQREIERLGSWAIDGVALQREFFAKTAEPMLGGDKKLYIIISDAFRYECAKELEERLNTKNRFVCNLSASLGVLPSYTQLGIASLLPHKSLSFSGDGDEVLVDGLPSSGVANRQKILDNCQIKAAYIKDEELLAFSQEAGREFVKGYSLIYIYHPLIDATGDKAATESGVFEAVERAYEEIERLLSKITSFNGTNVIITADHGFLYQNMGVEDTELCTLDKEGLFKHNRRYALSKESKKSDCVHPWSFEALGIDGRGYALIPKSINKLRVQGSGNRFVHGGASLQEVVVPVLHFGKKRKDNVTIVDVGVVKSFDKITSNQVGIALWQNEPIGEKVLPRTLLVGFYSEDGELLSNEERVYFDADGTDARDREKRLKFLFRGAVANYNGKKIYLTLSEIESGTTMKREYKKEPYTVFISFVNEFDEF